MKYSAVLLAAVAGAAIAGPVNLKRQDIDFDAYNAVPQEEAVGAPAGDVAPEVPAYTATAVASAAAAAATDSGDATMGSGNSALVDTTTASRMAKRGACDATTKGTGPQVSTPKDDAASFLAYSGFSTAANSAPAVDGFKRVVTNSNGSAQSPTYMTYTTLPSYDTNACALFCLQNQGCNTFNLYFERDPSVTPDDAGCPDPASYTYIKCSIYGGVLDSTSATNVGQWQSQFHVVIAGSNIYTATAPNNAVGYQAPVSLGNATINAPVKSNSYLGVQTFNSSTPFAPDVACAAACNATTAYVAKHGGAACNFFVAYILYKNKANPVFTCTYYNSAWDKTYAKNTGQWDSAGNHYTIGNAWAYAVNNAPTDVAATQPAAAALPANTPYVGK